MKIIIVGCSGRMGQAIEENAKGFGIEIAAGVDTQNRRQTDYPVYTDISQIQESADCIIDFSHHSMVKNVGEYAKSKKIPVLFGVTGMSTEELAYIDELSREIAVLQSANMSLGIQVLRMLAEKAGKILGELYDIEIIEKHHNQKKDAPSGTALLLYDTVKQAHSHAVFGREGKEALRQSGEIGIHAIRGGAIPGEHEVAFFGAYDELSLIHRARDRKVFAIGALQAAKFLYGRQSGRYDTSDIIQERLGE